jgi:hypothetical protein
MSVTVYDNVGEKQIFDNADKWECLPDGCLQVSKNGTTPVVLATFAPQRWERAVKTPKEDTALQFEEAIDLIKEVDGDKNWGNQTSEWQDRADSLISSVNK